jgi:GT2 family glycosyltransferase
VRTSAWLAGCCIVAQSETWRLVGGFDERYFLIWEDAEWSIRARRQGVRLLVVDEAIIQHHVGHSFQHAPTALASFYFTRNGLRYQWQYARRHVPRFIRDWLVRPAPSLLRHRRGNVLLFAWLGALAWLIGQVGPVPPALSRLAERR